MHSLSARPQLRDHVELHMSPEGTTGELVVLAGGRVSSPTVGYDDPPPQARPSLPELPRKIGRYAVLDVIGIGGMGVVCTAYDPKLDRKVALKLLRQREFEDPKRTATARARLHREARALAKLKHGNVVAVHDVDVFEGRLYIAMEYVEGQSLSEWLDERPRSWREIVVKFVQAARGLAAAHAAGITHRDFKPANVRVESGGRVVVLDFGLALEHGDPHSVERSLDDDDDDRTPIAAQPERLTAVGRRVGTPAYMAPEQMLNQGVGPAADQFAFGVSLYEALWGVLPFRGDAKTAMYAALDGQISPPPRAREVPAWLHRAVFRMLAREPVGRFRDMHELIDALERSTARRRRRRWLAAGGVVAAAAGLAGALWLGTGDPCPTARERVTAVWGPAQAEAVRSAFADTGSSFAAAAFERSKAILDERMAGWLALHEQVCEATRVRGEQSDALLDHRMACLDDRLLEASALVELLAGDEVDARMVEQAIDATLRLPATAPCLAARPGENDAPPLPHEQDQVLRVRETLAHAEAQLRAYRNAPALELARAAWLEAGALEHARTRVHARMVLAHALRRGGELAAAHEAYVAAIRDAARAHLFEFEADAWTMLVQLVGLDQHRPEQGLLHRVAAEAALERAGELPWQQAGLAHALGVVMRDADQSELALEQFRVAISVRQSIDPDEPQLAGTRNDLGLTLIRMGRWAEAEEQLALALDDARRVRGEDHPLVATTSLNLGNAVLEGRRDHDRARALYQRALAIREAVYGPLHPSVAEVLIALGVLHRRQGEWAASQGAFVRAVALMGGRDSKDIRAAAALNNLGQSAMAAGDDAAAVDAFTDAIAVFERAGRTRVVSRLRSVIHRCEANVHLGHLAAARSDCDAARQLLPELADPASHDVSDLAVARSALARSEGRGAEAVALAREALEHDLAHDRPLSDQRRSQLALAQALAAHEPAAAELATLRRTLAHDADRLDDAALRDEIAAWLAVTP
ncbi:MAG: serine/threonine protein kinase [Nannocystaceae bacterium]|nr:serine/threonine protein kinase [Nannocystaceae bacterium]